MFGVLFIFLYSISWEREEKQWRWERIERWMLVNAAWFSRNPSEVKTILPDYSWHSWGVVTITSVIFIAIRIVFIIGCLSVSKTVSNSNCVCRSRSRRRHKKLTQYIQQNLMKLHYNMVVVALHNGFIWTRKSKKQRWLEK